MTDAAVGGLESAAEPRGPERITFPCFDGFRALAAIVVLVTHVAFLSGFNGRSRFGAFTARMDVGVAIFFMISGFLLYRPFVAARLADSPVPRAVAYFWRRGLRILPAYWVALTITVFLLHVPKELPSVGDLFLFYGLFHLYSLGNVIGPILSSYTLVTEISFYVFLPLYALAISRWARDEPTRQCRRQLRVNQTASGDTEHRMVALPCRIFQRSGDIARFEQWVVAEDLVTAGARGKQAEHVRDPNSQAAKAGASTTLGRIDGDSAQFAHCLCLCAAYLPARCDFAVQ